MLSKITFTLMLVCYVSSAALKMTSYNSLQATNSTDASTAAAIKPEYINPTCKSYSFTGPSTLNGINCNNGQGGRANLTLDLDTCLANIESKLEWAASGSFGQSCKDMKISSEAVLSGSCQVTDGTYYNASINLMHHVYNTGSALKCNVGELCNTFTLDGATGVLSAKCGGQAATLDLNNCVSLNGKALGMQKSGNFIKTGKASGCTLTNGNLKCNGSNSLNVAPYITTASGTGMTCVAPDLVPSTLNPLCYSIALSGANVVGQCANGIGGLIRTSAPAGSVLTSNLGVMTGSVVEGTGTPVLKDEDLINRDELNSGKKKRKMKKMK